MMQNNTAQAILNEARKRVTGYALHRVETAFTMGVSLALTGLSLADVGLPRDSWWVWPALGAAGVGAIVTTALKANRYVQRFTAGVFYERFDADRLHLPDLRRGVAQVFEHHRMIFGAIAARPQASLGLVAQDMDEWVADIYAVAESMDRFLNDSRVLDSMRVLVQPLYDETGEAGQSQALLRLDPEAQALNDHERRMLLHVKDAVADAKARLEDALSTMTHIHHQIRSARAHELGRAFAERTHMVIEDQRLRLSEAGELVQALFRQYAGAEGDGAFAFA